MHSNGEESGKAAAKTPTLPQVGARVKITSGAFEGFEGTVESVDTLRLRFTVSAEIFNRLVPVVDLESWQVEIPEE